jgi:hypothetical protein
MTSIDIGRSGIQYIDKPSCPECRSGTLLAINGIVVEKGTWSGEDIFYARGLPGIIITTSRFREFFDAHGISGGILVPAEEYRIVY